MPRFCYGAIGSALAAALALSIPSTTLAATVPVHSAKPARTTAIAAAAAYQVSATVSSGAVVLGQRVTLSGSVSPSATDGAVIVQRLVGDSWARVARVALSATSTYRYVFSPERAGIATYRVLKRGDQDHALGVSRRKNVTTRRWHYLADRDAVVGGLDVETLSINGTSYRKSLGEWPDDYSDYNLYRKCSQMTVTTGLSDDYSTDWDGEPPVANLEILADGNSLFAKDYALGQSDSLTLDVSGYLRVRMETTYVMGDPYSAFGSPRVLCAF